MNLLLGPYRPLVIAKRWMLLISFVPFSFGMCRHRGCCRFASYTQKSSSHESVPLLGAVTPSNPKQLGLTAKVAPIKPKSIPNISASPNIKTDAIPSTSRSAYYLSSSANGSNSCASSSRTDEKADNRKNENSEKRKKEEKQKLKAEKEARKVRQIANMQ